MGSVKVDGDGEGTKVTVSQAALSGRRASREVQPSGVMAAAPVTTAAAPPVTERHQSPPVTERHHL